MKNHQLFSKYNQFFMVICMNISIVIMLITKLFILYNWKMRCNWIISFVFVFYAFDTFVFVSVGLWRFQRYNANVFYPVLHIYISVNATNSGNSTNNAIRFFLYISIGFFDLHQQCVKNICNRLCKLHLIKNLQTSSKE